MTRVKQCSGCGATKPLDAFGLLRGRPRSQCKSCAVEASRVYRETYRGQVRTAATRESRARYRLKHMTPERQSYTAMRHRCTLPGHVHWRYYGGRGITVCSRWLGPDGFANFLTDMGQRPPGTTLDRIDPDGHYEPSNCRWADARTQRGNQREAARELA